MSFGACELYQNSLASLLLEHFLYEWVYFHRVSKQLYCAVNKTVCLTDLSFPRCFFQDLKLQTEDSFILKVVQLEELLAVRHSVFVLGPAGTGKTQVIKTLNKTYQNQKRKPLLHDINPKAVTADELFGFINPATREWKDGEPC